VGFTVPLHTTVLLLLWLSLFLRVARRKRTRALVLVLFKVGRIVWRFGFKVLRLMVG
jgi:hypothetical protein